MIEGAEMAKNWVKSGFLDKIATARCGEETMGTRLHDSYVVLFTIKIKNRNSKLPRKVGIAFHIFSPKRAFWWFFDTLKHILPNGIFSGKKP